MKVVLRVTAGPARRARNTSSTGHDTFVVGRSSQAQFSMPDDRLLSREHFLIEFNPPVCFLRDLGSTNGTKVNGLRVETVRLRDGDVITAGDSAFVIRVEETSERVAPRSAASAAASARPRDIAVGAVPGDDADRLALRRLRRPPPAVSRPPTPTT